MEMLYQDGVAALQESARLYGQCCRSMMQTWGLDFSQLPSGEVNEGHLYWRELCSKESQIEDIVEAWARAEVRLRREVGRRGNVPPPRAASPALSATELDHRQYAVMANALKKRLGSQMHTDQWDSLEALARMSLARAVDSFNFLEETDIAGLAHQHAHKVAALVGGIFGCVIEYGEGIYWDTCPISLMHHRWGLSAGFTAIRRCSLCGEDLDVCEHMLGASYEVQVQRDAEGVCNACGSRSCSHIDGQTELSYPHAVMTDAEFHEVSLVPKPRDPLARITKLELDPQLLHRLAGEPDGRDIRCFRCLQPCNGFMTLPN
jgi:hypothetical protein